MKKVIHFLIQRIEAKTEERVMFHYHGTQVKISIYNYNRVR